MRRIKVVSEPTDLVPILRAFDSDTKRDVFNRIIDGWVTVSAIEQQFGAEGAEALQFFEKTKLVETRWESIAGKTEKAYHAYYTSFHINTAASVQDFAEILSVASMPEMRYRQVESEIEALAAGDGCSARAVTEKLGIPSVRLRALLKRSSKFEVRGHVVRKVDG